MKKTFYLIVCVLCTLLVFPAAAQIPGYVPTEGLVGWWPFNGNANDESGNGHEGTVNGATLAEDRFGVVNSAYYFNSSDNSFIQIEAPSVNILSICGWFKCSTPNKYYPRIFWYGRYSSQSAPTTALSAGIMGNEPSWIANYTGKFYNETNVGGSAINHDMVTADDTWHHFVVSLDSNAIITTYIDGIFAMNNNLTNSVNIINPLFFLGRDPNDDYAGPSQGRFDGLIDDVAMFNRALTSQEIQNLYAFEAAPSCTPLPSNLQEGLVGYWPFCGNANDESGNGNDGTVNGATLTEDRFGNANAAYDFDGVDDYIDCGNSSMLNPENITISVWISQNSIPQNTNFQQTILGKTSFFDGEIGYRMITDFDSKNYFIWSPDDVQYDFTLTQSNIELSSWTHLLAIKNADNLKIFKNGFLENQLVYPRSPLQNNNPFIIGSVRDIFITAPHLVRFFDGQIDDIGIWNRALTPEEVQELYTLDACTFTVYDTSYVTVYDTLTTYETVYDTLYTYETSYDTVTTYVTVTDTLLIDITFTGFEGQPSWLNTVTVFPNPASDHITIDYGNFALMAGYNTIITDAAGATVYSSAVNSQQVEIDINAWGAMGVYYLSVYDASGALVAVRHIVLE